MSFCTRCGALSAPGQSFCAACGAALVPLAPTAAPWIQPPAPLGPRPTGRVMEPWLVALFAFVTLGIYGIVWAWRVSREMDAFEGRPGHAHEKVRAGVWLGLGAAACFIVGVVFLALAVPASRDGGELTPQAAANLAVGVLVLIGSVVAAIVAAVFLLLGHWRVWEGIRADEVRRGVIGPLSPGLMLAFYLIPYVNIVTSWIMYIQTQRSLNAMWRLYGNA